MATRKIAARLASLTVADLKVVCKDAGLTGIPVRKADIVDSLSRHLAQALCRPQRVLSIDVGYRNLAWACLDGNRLIGWRRETLVGSDLAGKEKGEAAAESERIYDPAVFASNVHRVFGHMEAAIRSSSGPSSPTPASDRGDDCAGGLAVVIERQRMLPGQSGFTVFMVNSVEGMLWSAFLHPTFIRRYKQPTMVSLPPGQVSKWFQHGGAGKKSAATLLVDLLLSSPTHTTLIDRPTTDSQTNSRVLARPNQLQVPRVFAEQFGKEKKRDDMADALLQALAYQDWRANGAHFAHALDVGGGGSAATLVGKEARPFNWRSALTGGSW